MLYGRAKEGETVMKVAVSSTGNHLDSLIDPRFGRCAYFVFVETDDMAYEAFENTSMALGGGAGIQSAQFVASKGAKVVITGNCGPNAVRTLSAAGIDLILGQMETVRQAVEDFKNGRLQKTTEPNVADHYGMGGARAGTGSCRGGGRGMGRGMGRGQGRGTGQGGALETGTMGSLGSGAGRAQLAGKRGDLESLKEQADRLARQLQALQERIRSQEET